MTFDQTFAIRWRDVQGKIQWVEVPGTCVILPGLANVVFFLHHAVGSEPALYNISEQSSGMSFVVGYSDPRSAIDDAYRLVAQEGPEKIKHTIEAALLQYGPYQPLAEEEGYATLHSV